MATRSILSKYRNFTVALLLGGFCALVLVGDRGSVSAQSQPNTYFSSVTAKQKRFLDDAKEFSDYARTATPDSFESDEANDLVTAAFETNDQLGAASTLIGVYDDLQCKDDRARARPLIELSLRAYSKDIGSSVERINNRDSSVLNADFTAKVLHMRDDLRDAQSFLDSIKLQ